MGRNRTRADNRNYGGRTAARGKRDATKVSKLAELARQLERTQQLPVGLMPLEVNQFKATGALPRETKRVAQIIRGPRRGGAVDRRVGPIERTQRAIEMAKKSMGVLAKLGFKEAKPYLEVGMQACDKYKVIATDFMGWPALTTAVMDHTFEKKRGFKFDGDQQLKYQVSWAQLENTSADGTYFPRPEGGEYKHIDPLHLFKKVASVKSAPFYGSPNFPHDFATRSVMFPLKKFEGHDQTNIHDLLFNFFSAQTHNAKAPHVVELSKKENEAMCNAVLDIATSDDPMKYFDKPTSECVHTRDYEIILNEVVGETVFDHNSMVLKVEVHRKMATAVPTAICSDPGSQVMPLFEEAIIYVQRVENTEYKYTKSCLVLSSTPVVKDTLAHMHVIGDNAFTLELHDGFKNSGDRHQKSMTNVGVVVGLLDKVERLSQLDPAQRGTTEAAFDFLLGADHTRAKAHLQKVVADKKKTALKAAANEAARTAVENNYRNDPSSEDSRLLSNSFLANQLKKAAINTADPARMPQVRHWISSATFSFITIQIEGTSRSYCFIQSFSPTNQTPHNSSPKVMLDETPAPTTMKRRVVWNETNGISHPKSIRRVPTGITDIKPPPSLERGSSVPRIYPPYTPRKGADTYDPYRSYTAPVAARYTSSLPPELELELELL
jgi:hypothetical protein